MLAVTPGHRATTVDETFDQWTPLVEAVDP
ncbi:hypothetical protein JO380_001424 [Cellulomonas iranensis]|uniref:Uncharacterized protein n=1 Tax=Cellulomonas iranensis TaxID=76862 RepID=A0ABU0GI51_9CELL|nr:hypothetical protein [Cellulomonas iranensis]